MVDVDKCFLKLGYQRNIFKNGIKYVKNDYDFIFFDTLERKVKFGFGKLTKEILFLIKLKIKQFF